MATRLSSSRILDPLRKFRFTVHSIAGRPSIPEAQPVGFTDVDGLSLGDTESIEYVDGNDIFIRKLAGRTKFGEVTLKKGFDLGRHCENWREAVMESLADAGIPGVPVRDTLPDGTRNEADFRSDLLVRLYDRVESSGRPTTPYAEWLVKGAWPKSLAYDGLSAADSGVLMVTMVLCVDSIHLVKPVHS